MRIVSFSQDEGVPFPGFTFSFASAASSFLTFGFTSVSEFSSSMSTSSFSLAELELGVPLFVLLVANESFDCFGGAFVPLGFPKNFL